MDYSAHWAKLRNREAPFRTGWAWIVTGLSMAFIGALPLLAVYRMGKPDEVVWRESDWIGITGDGWDRAWPTVCAHGPDLDRIWDYSSALLPFCINPRIVLPTALYRPTILVPMPTPMPVAVPSRTEVSGRSIPQRPAKKPVSAQTKTEA